MSGSVFSKLEIDVSQQSEIAEAVEFTFKYRLPALVVHQGLAGDALLARDRIGGQFKIIAPIDSPKGEVFGTQKLRGLNTSALQVDGFEILLTGDKSVLDTRNEAMALTDFIKKHLSQRIEVRFVLNVFSRDKENINRMLEGLKTVRTPAFIRNDIGNKLQVSKANADIHNACVNNIREYIGAPIKISGNISTLKSIADCPEPKRYAVSLSNARTIVKEFQSQPKEIHELLKSDQSNNV